MSTTTTTQTILTEPTAPPVPPVSAARRGNGRAGTGTGTGTGKRIPSVRTSAADLAAIADLDDLAEIESKLQTHLVDPTTIKEVDRFKRLRRYTGSTKQELSIPELAETILQEGQTDPCGCYPTEDGLVLYSGHRRKAAVERLRLAGHDIRLLIVVTELTEDEAFRRAILLNVQRENHTAEELGTMIQLVREENHLVGTSCTKDVAKYFGFSPATIAQLEKFMTLPEDVRRKVDNEESTVRMSVAAALEAATSPKELREEVIRKAQEAAERDARKKLEKERKIREGDARARAKARENDAEVKARRAKEADEREQKRVRAVAESAERKRLAKLEKAQTAELRDELVRAKREVRESEKERASVQAKAERLGRKGPAATVHIEKAEKEFVTAVEREERAGKVVEEVEGRIKRLKEEGPTEPTETYDVAENTGELGPTSDELPPAPVRVCDGCGKPATLRYSEPVTDASWSNQLLGAVLGTGTHNLYYKCIGCGLETIVVGEARESKDVTGGTDGTGGPATVDDSEPVGAETEKEHDPEPQPESEPEPVSSPVVPPVHIETRHVREAQRSIAGALKKLKAPKLGEVLVLCEETLDTTTYAKEMRLLASTIAQYGHGKASGEEVVRVWGDINDLVCLATKQGSVPIPGFTSLRPYAPSERSADEVQAEAVTAQCARMSALATAKTRAQTRTAKIKKTAATDKRPLRPSRPSSASKGRVSKAKDAMKGKAKAKDKTKSKG